MITLQQLRMMKPSQIVDAMINGLEYFDMKKDSFCIDMKVYKESDGEICYGCAASCAIQYIAGKEYDPKILEDTLSARRHVRAANSIGIEYRALGEFESVVDSLRIGTIAELMEFCSHDDDYIPSKTILKLENNLRCLQTDNWKERLPDYKELSEKLKGLGL